MCDQASVCARVCGCMQVGAHVWVHVLKYGCVHVCVCVEVCVCVRAHVRV